MKKLRNDELDPTVIDWPVYMRRAIDLAGNVISASPNPRVGCVLVAGEQIVGEGWHVAPGEDHAEVMALKQAGAKARGATAFVSLEPCSHTGRTGPCSDALIDAGVGQVVIASIDPNPDVSGQGAERLIAAGIEVTQLLEFDSIARAVNPGYFKRRECGLPFVRVKIAMSLDGKTALANGESKWISSPAARRDVQLLRAASGAVLTGIETVLVDDPALNVRVDELPLTADALARNQALLDRQPLRVVLDSRYRLPPSARITQEPGSVLVFGAAPPAEKRGNAANMEYRQAGDGERVNLQTVLESLASEMACTDVLVEAGATLSTAFLQAGLVDEMIVYIAPKLLGSDARALLNIAGISAIAEAPEFEISDLHQIDQDIRVTLKPRANRTP